jgi:hypothetical protein
MNPAKNTGTIEEGCTLPKTMKVRARYEAENESKRERKEIEQSWQSAKE